MKKKKREKKERNETKEINVGWMERERADRKQKKGRNKSV